MSPADDRQLRAAMVDEQIATRDVDDPRVLAAMRRVPRYRFVPTAALPDASADRPSAIAEAAAASVPDALLGQLADGVLLVLPVDRGPGRDLLHLRRDGERITRESRDRVRFVPLIPESRPEGTGS